MGDDSQEIPIWCPRCHLPVGDASTCPSCQLPHQASAEAARLREVVWRIHEAGTEISALRDEIGDLATEKLTLLDRLTGDEPEPSRTPARTATRPQPRSEWRPERIRDVLLWLGTALLILSAITFAVVAWARLEPGGRAGLLFAATVVAASLSALTRRRLRPTAEALAALATALALIDWGVIRVTAAGDGFSAAAWWALGLAVVGVAHVAIRTRADLEVTRVGPLLLIPAAMFAGLLALEPSPTGFAIGMTALSTLLVLADWLLVRRGEPAWVRAVLTVERVGAGTLMYGATAVSSAIARSDGTSGVATVAALATMVPPLLSLRLRRDQSGASWFAGLATFGLLGAVATVAHSLSGDPRTVALTVAGGAVAVTMLARGARERADAIAGVAGLAILPALALAASDVTQAWLGPLRTWDVPGAGSVADLVGSRLVDDLDPVAANWETSVAALLVGALWCTLGRTPTHAAARPALLHLTVALAPLAFVVAVTQPSFTIGAVFAGQLLAVAVLAGTGLALVRRQPTTGRLLLLGAAVVAVPAAGWAGTTTATAMVAIGVAGGIGAIGAAVFVDPPRSVASLVVAVAAGFAEIGIGVTVLVDRSAAGFVVTAAAGAVLGALRLWPRPGLAPRRRAAEVSVIGAAAIGIAMSLAAPGWRALSLAITVPAVVLAGRRRDDRAPAFDAFGLALAIAASAACLAPAMDGGETIAIAAALGALGAALIPRRDPAVASWLSLGPGLVLGFTPSVVLAIRYGGLLRPGLVVAAAVVVLGLGVLSRLNAPITGPTIVLVVIGIDQIAPVAAALPRWLVIGIAGALVLFAGITADRRIAQLRRWRSQIDALG